MSQLVQVMRTLRSMPPLPNVAQRVLQIVRDPEYSIDNLVQVVRTDPSLTTRILKLCNSPLYGLGQEICSVSDAVAYLGTRNLVKLVLVSCTAAYFRGVKSSSFGNANELWRHTIACATACQSLAERCGYEQPATAFTAGIVHNVGKIALSQVVDEALLARSVQAAEGEHASYVEVERKALGLDHANAGGIVTETWNLPVDLRRAVRNHHDVTHIRNDGDLTALLHIADTTVLGLGIGVPFQGIDYSSCPEAMAKLHLEPSDLVGLSQVVNDELKRSTELLNLEAIADR
jgi:HD-like signal output (HDOD) protein